MSKLNHLKNLFNNRVHRYRLAFYGFVTLMLVATMVIRQDLPVAALPPSVITPSEFHYSNTAAHPAQLGSSTNVAPNKSSQSVAEPQNCVPDTSYATPSPIDLTSQASGLTQISDPVSYYQVYGNTPGELQTEAHSCAPQISNQNDSDFAAETSYNLTWRYSWTVGADGLCSINQAQVGQHINMILPQWQPSPYATNGLAGAWQTYINNLLTHENGHAGLDRQYAAQLLADLQNYPATDCSSINASVQAKVNADVMALNAANDTYDQQTDHGATQGAILP